MYREPDSTLIGLGVGTTKVSVVVAKRDPRLFNAVQIMGIGSAVSQGIRKGLIVNLEQAKQAVRNAVDDAENMVGFELNHATVSFNAIDVASVTSNGMISLERSRPIQVEDIERVIKAAKNDLSIPANKVTLHTIPVKYSIDGNFSIDDPLGMTGARLEIALQSVTVPTPYIQNVVNCVEASGLEVEDLVIKPIASALGALTDEEMRVGAISLSIGGGTTGLTYYKEGCPVKVAIIPIGGDHITRDLANVLRLPQNKAEELKKHLFDEDDEPILLASKGQPERVIDRAQAVEVVACRLEELFDEHIVPTIPDHDLKQFPGGIVLSGGVAQTAGIGEMLSDTFKMPVRVADPQDFYEMPPGRNDSSYVSALGTIRYILSKERNPYRFIDSPISQWRGAYIPSEPRETRSRHTMDKISGVKNAAKKFWEFTKDFF